MKLCGQRNYIPGSGLFSNVCHLLIRPVNRSYSLLHCSIRIVQCYQPSRDLDFRCDPGIAKKKSREFVTYLLF